MRELRIHARTDDYGDKVELAIFYYDTIERHPHSVATNVTFEEYDRANMARPFIIGLERAAAQRLLEGLWEQGLRPKSMPQEGVVEAMREHIADLRESHRALLNQGVRVVHIEGGPPNLGG